MSAPRLSDTEVYENGELENGHCLDSETVAGLSDIMQVEHAVIDDMEESEIVESKEDNNELSGEEDTSLTTSIRVPPNSPVSDVDLDKEEDNLQGLGLGLGFASFSSSSSSGAEAYDFRVELGDYDLNDILEAEEDIDVEHTPEEQEILRQYELLAATIGLRSRGPGLNAPILPPPGFNAPPPPEYHFRHPQAPNMSLAPPNAPIARPFEVPQVPKINGVEVVLMETAITDGELWLYTDRVCGRWRVRYTSRLRLCWYPRD
jgi:hypothetical protein